MLGDTGPCYHFNTSEKELITALDVWFGPNSSKYTCVAAVNLNTRMHHSLD